MFLLQESKAMSIKEKLKKKMQQQLKKTYKVGAILLILILTTGPEILILDYEVHIQNSSSRIPYPEILINSFSFRTPHPELLI